jgi:pyrroline-5-carboxylate reductase
MAGITIKTLIEGLEHRAVIRVMPNTPAQVNESMSVWTATPDVADVQKENAAAILRSIGKEIYIEDEKYLNMVTAASGSGPAYFFLFVELLTEAAIRTGLPENMAYELILQTMIGSGKMMRDTGMEPARLREMVTSKGGTTAAALDVFEKRHLKETVTEAVTAAFTRALELGGEK